MDVCTTAVSCEIRTAAVSRDIPNEMSLEQFKGGGIITRDVQLVNEHVIYQILIRASRVNMSMSLPPNPHLPIPSAATAPPPLTPHPPSPPRERPKPA